MSKQRARSRTFSNLCVAGGCAFALFSTSFAAAQYQPKPRRVSAAYFGDNVTNPGASIGYEAAFYYRRPHELFGGAHIGGFNSADPPYYGLFIYIEAGYRLNFNVGFFLEARAGLGYVNIARNTVLTQADGTMTQGPNTSENNLAPIGMGGLGFDLYPRTKVPISLFADVGGMGRYSSTTGFGGGLVFTSGLAYQFGTQRPRPPDTSVPPTPVPVAPPNLDGQNLPPGVENNTPPMPPSAPLQPTQPGELSPPPSLPPPPIYPGN